MLAVDPSAHTAQKQSERDPLISLLGVGLNRDGRWLVRHVDLAFHRGEIVTLIGPNGSGKSTTVKLALGIHKPDEGRVERKNGLRIGYVPQRLTVEWSLPLTVNRFMGLTERLDHRARDAALEACGVEDLGRAEMRTLSGGEFQRVLLARAIARKPDLLVLDEPVQGVDFAGEVALYELIGKVRSEIGCGVVLVSHDLHVVMAATDRVICFNGHVCCEGTPTAVAASDEYRNLFGVRGAKTLAVYEHNHDHTHLPDGRVRHADGTITDHCHGDDGHHHGKPSQRSGKPHEDAEQSDAR